MKSKKISELKKCQGQIMTGSDNVKNQIILKSDNFRAKKWILHTSILEKLTLIKKTLLLQNFQKKTKKKTE